MLAILFPAQIDNRFRGQWAGLILFGLVTLMKLVIGVNSTLFAATVAQNADGIPVSSFAPAAANEVVRLFTQLGMMHVTMALLCIVALIRYRAMIPMLFVLLLAERGIRQIVISLAPAAPHDPNAPGAIVALALVAAMVVGLLLSLWPRRMPRTE